MEHIVYKNKPNSKIWSIVFFAAIIIAAVYLFYAFILKPPIGLEINLSQPIVRAEGLKNKLDNFFNSEQFNKLSLRSSLFPAVLTALDKNSPLFKTGNLDPFTLIKPAPTAKKK